MECPYCQSKNFEETYGHPYPYLRVDKNNKPVQLIKRFKCECEYPFFTEVRHGVFQQYKYGLYQFAGKE